MSGKHLYRTFLIVEAFFELATLEFSRFLAVWEMESFLYEAIDTYD